MDRLLDLWSADEPDLDGLGSFPALTFALEIADYDRRDRILLALLNHAPESGEHGQIATYLVVMCLAPVVPHIVGRILRKLHRASDGASIYPAHDVQTVVLGDLWEQVRRYPLHRRHHVAANLVMDTQGASMRSLGVHCRQRAMVTVTLDDVDELASAPTTLSSSEELLELLAWALEQQWLDEQDIAVLTYRYFGADTGRDGVATDQQLADSMGISRPTASRRRAGAQQRLAAAALARLEAEQDRALPHAS